MKLTPPITGSATNASLPTNAAHPLPHRGRGQGEGTGGRGERAGNFQQLAPAASPVRRVFGLFAARPLTPALSPDGGEGEERRLTPYAPPHPSRLRGAQSLSSLNLCFLLLSLLLFPLPAAEPQNTSAIQSLKPGPGREQIQINCIPCHSTAIIAATHATRARWDELITTMQQKHGLWPLVPTIRTQLLDYLAATQPPTDPALDAGKQTPWAQPLYRPNPLW